MIKVVHVANKVIGLCFLSGAQKEESKIRQADAQEKGREEEIRKESHAQVTKEVTHKESHIQESHA